MKGINALVANLTQGAEIIPQTFFCLEIFTKKGWERISSSLTFHKPDLFGWLLHRFRLVHDLQDKI